MGVQVPPLAPVMFHTGVVKWETRMLQEHMAARSWGFDSPLQYYGKKGLYDPAG